MKSWRIIVVFTLLLTMPISLWASVAMASHCLMSETSSHSSHAQMDHDNEPMHSDDHETSQHMNEQPNCECDENLNCSISGCGAIALLNKTAIEVPYSMHFVYQNIHSLADPVDPELLFRPPISNS